MQAIIVKEIGNFSIENIPIPQPKENEVLIKMAITGLCRTDLKIIEVGHRDLELPRIPGEEVVGTISEVGPKLPKTLVGTRVYVYPGTSCGTCKPCLQGAGNLCKDMQIMGFHRDGGFAEYVIAPVQSIIPIPDECPFEQAVFAEPLSCCLNALELSGLKPKETIGIWGGGPAGALLARAAKALGADVTVIEPHLQRHSYHSKVFATVPDEYFDVAIVAVGSAHAYQEAIAHLNPRGRLVVFSGLSKETSMQNIDLNQLHYRECTLVGAYGCSYRHSVDAITMIHTKQVEVQSLISHRLPLSDLAIALDLVKYKSGMKIILHP
ncbi:MAG: alcohol dehydrogenase catalytic domain-containing protein [Bacteroidales bacterium]|nr:alcohol dehydrogenase catalytic domain-containing protein [Bacteroidales bacterium]